MNWYKMMKGAPSNITRLIVFLATAILNFRTILDSFSWIYELLCKLKGRKERELEMILYLDRIYGGENRNQRVIVYPSQASSYSFGQTAVNDWPLYDSHGPGRRLIARARGIHLHSMLDGSTSSGWSVYMSLVFQDDCRYRGSTLEVMGVMSNECWAIVGGTGRFTRAQGIVQCKTIESRTNNDVMKLNIHAVYSPLP